MEFEQAKEIINKSKSIYIVAHVNPDGDAIGSTYGMYFAMKKLNKDVHVIMPEYSDVFKFLPDITKTALPKQSRKIAVPVKSALAELGCTTCSLQTVLLTLLHTRIAGQEASLLQDSAVLIALLQQGAAQAVADSASLTGNTAAGNADDDVILALEAQQDQRRADDQLQGLQTEVVVDITIVDGDLTGAGVNANAGNGILTTTSAVEIRFGFVHVRLPPS